MKLKSYHRYNQLKVAFDLLSKCNGNRVLDAGCGDGLLEQYFTDRQVIGLDISLPALYNARKNAPWSKYVLADVKRLPIRDLCIDNVAMIAVLGGVAKGEEAIVFREAKRVLKYGGNLIILVSQKRQPYSLLVPDRLFGGWKWRHFNAQILQKQLKENGFEITDTIFVGGIISLGLSLFNYSWNRFWQFFTQRIMERVVIPHLPYSFLSKIEGLEFNTFKGMPQTFARFFYIVAKKV